MLGPLGGPELIIIALVIFLIFGVGKLSGLGKDLGSSIKEFRKAVKDEDAEKKEVLQATAQQAPPQVQYQAPPQVVQQQPQPAPPTTTPGDAKNIF